jgi:REP element-mobilizing transposase RayT
MSDQFSERRNSSLELNEIYFWTCTVKDWKHLLRPDKYKHIILANLQKLVDRGLIAVYGFVIMPNHIHLIWELLEMNGKEKPHASFNKATAHKIRIDLKLHHPQVLAHFLVNERERQYRIWQRDPLAILMDSQKKLEQKLEYIHLNPLQEKWSLCRAPELYPWSSAAYYEYGRSDFDFLTRIDIDI